MASILPHVIFGVHVIDRGERAPTVQSVLTEFGDNIKTRVGLHDVHEGFCSPNGLLLIEFLGDQTRADAFLKRITAIPGVEVKRMVFEHP